MSERSSWWKRPLVWVPSTLVTVGIAVVALAAFQPWTLFIDVTVDEALPASAPASTATGTPTDEETAQESVEASSDEDPATEDQPVDAELSATAEAKPERVVTAEGTFISHEHPTSGKARIITLADGSRVLRLVGLDTDNGPDLKVWLASAPVIAGRDGWFVFDDEDYLSLGALKGNKGNQNYPIPDDADISDLTSVTIWCERFSVSFGAAELQNV